MSIPRRHHFRRRLTVILAALALTLLGLSGTASAAPSTISTSATPTTLIIGGTGTVTVTFTNNQAYAVDFDYESLSSQPLLDGAGSTLNFVSCAGDVSWCGPNGTTIEWWDTTPIAPGATTTVTLTYNIPTNAPCGTINGEQASILLLAYNYDEYNDNNQDNESSTDGVPYLTINCS